MRAEVKVYEYVTRDGESQHVECVCQLCAANTQSFFEHLEPYVSDDAYYSTECEQCGIQNGDDL